MIAPAMRQARWYWPTSATTRVLALLPRTDPPAKLGPIHMCRPTVPELVAARHAFSFRRGGAAGVLRASSTTGFPPGRDIRATGLEPEEVFAYQENRGAPVDILSAVSIRFRGSAIGNLSIVGQSVRGFDEEGTCGYGGHAVGWARQRRGVPLPGGAWCRRKSAWMPAIPTATSSTPSRARRGRCLRSVACAPSPSPRRSGAVQHPGGRNAAAMNRDGNTRPDPGRSVIQAGSIHHVTRDALATFAKKASGRRSRRRSAPGR